MGTQIEYKVLYKENSLNNHLHLYIIYIYPWRSWQQNQPSVQTHRTQTSHIICYSSTWYPLGFYIHNIFQWLATCPRGRLVSRGNHKHNCRDSRSVKVILGNIFSPMTLLKYFYVKNNDLFDFINVYTQKSYFIPLTSKISCE
jgi:hypothetical protein